MHLQNRPLEVQFDFPLTMGILKQGSIQVNYFLLLLEINQIYLPSHLFKKIYLFVWLQWVLAVACSIFDLHSGMQALS